MLKIKNYFRRSHIIILFLICTCLIKCYSIEIDLRNTYQVWCVGICDQDKSNVPTVPGTVLMGGGTDTIEAFEWQIKNANGGDFVVLRASGDDAYNEWIYNISVGIDARLNSVRTVLFKNQKASLETEVLDILRNAEAVFFAGGDQSDYIKFWSYTEVQYILQEKVQNVTIGGTSAGLAILGNWIYSAEKGSIESDEALANPYNRVITLVPALLKIPYLDHIITDSHFVTRDRMGRMLTFVARILKDSSGSDSTSPVVTIVHGVGVDEHTALLLNHSTGEVQAVGVNTAYVCTNSHLLPEVCEEKVPLTFKDIKCTRLNAFKNDRYSFAAFEADNNNNGIDYDNNIIDGHFTTDSPYGGES